MFWMYLIIGVVAGSQYALFAAGLSMLFGTSRVLNFAHGALFVIGGYILSLLAGQGLSNALLGVCLTALLGGILNAIILEIGLTPIRARTSDYVSTALVTVGMVTIILTVLLWIFGDVPKVVPIDMSIAFRLQNVPVTNTSAISMFSAPIVMVALALVVARTRFGLLLRAVAGNPTDAQLQGVNTTLIMRLSVLISGSLAAFAGALYAAGVTNISTDVGSLFMIKGIALVIVGGMGSIWGAVLVAYVVGIGEAFTAGYVGSSWQDIVVLGLLLIILSVRPSGLLGRSEITRF